MTGRSKPTISFEFFPPKSPEAAEDLWQDMPKLAALGPKYMTVTYGAAGSTKDGTLETLRRSIKTFPDIPFASHLTFLSTPKAELHDYIDSLWDSGVKSIVALRGDLPKGASYDDFTGDEYYGHTAEFVRILKERHPFTIIVGAYPEKHPDAPSLQADIDHLKKKCDAGADYVTTQFFFDTPVFFDFVEKCRAAGITAPINPGVIPVHDFKSLTRFAAKCGAGVPDWLQARFEGLDDQPEEARKVAEEILIRQCEELAKGGAAHIHFYTMNKAAITMEACGAIL